MPGWGGWAGAGIDPSKVNKNRKNFKNNRRHRKRLIIKPSEVLTTQEDKEQLIRKDKDLEHVIISEKKDTKIAAFQVVFFLIQCEFFSFKNKVKFIVFKISELPHNFCNVADFESKINQPIGRTWNPDQKFRKLITPRVKTRMGTIIEPIDKDDITHSNKYKKKFKKNENK